MSQDQWSAVDRYLTDLFIPPDPALETALQATAAAGMPLINVAPNQGALLQIPIRPASGASSTPVRASAGNGPIDWDAWLRPSIEALLLENHA